MYQQSSTQGSLLDSEFQMSDKKRKRLGKSWAQAFRMRCFPLINEEIFRPLYCEDNGAPCKSIRLVVAALILQAWFDLTDAETQEHIDCHLAWHLALGLDPCNDNDYVSQRTLQYFRAKLLKHPLIVLLFFELLERLRTLLGLHLGQQRLDTTHIQSHFARLSRLGVFCETHRVLLKALRLKAPALLETLPLSLRRRYLDEDGTDSSYDDARASDSRRRLGVAARDAYRLREALRGVSLPADAEQAYALLVRLVAEHCVVVDAPHSAAEGDADADLPPVPVVAKEAKLLTGAVLQTPHDPDVTYSGHKGQGYEALIVETCAPENVVQLITHVSLERSCASDADRIAPTLEALAARGLTPESLLADTGFGSVENVAACAQQGVELIAPQPGNAGATPEPATPRVRDEEFTLQLVPSQPPSVCPCGVEAVTTVLRDDPEEGPVAVLQMPTAACAACPRRDGCPALTLASGETWLLIALTENLPPQRRAAEQTAVFRDRYRARAGIEGTNSELKRGQGLGKLRVRGTDRVELALVLRAIACNVKRAVQYWTKQAKQAAKADQLTARFALTAWAEVCPGGWNHVQVTAVPHVPKGYACLHYDAAA